MKDWFVKKPPNFKLPRRHGQLWQSVHDWLSEGSPGGKLKVLVQTKEEADRINRTFAFLDGAVEAAVVKKVTYPPWPWSEP